MKCFRSNNETFEYSLLTFYFLSTYTFIYSSSYYSTKKRRKKEMIWNLTFSSNVVPTLTSIEYINLHERFRNLLPFLPVIPSKIPSTIP